MWVKHMATPSRARTTNCRWPAPALPPAVLMLVLRVRCNGVNAAAVALLPLRVMDDPCSTFPTMLQEVRCCAVLEARPCALLQLHENRVEGWLVFCPDIGPSGRECDATRRHRLLQMRRHSNAREKTMQLMGAHLTGAVVRRSYLHGPPEKQLER